MRPRLSTAILSAVLLLQSTPLSAALFADVPDVSPYAPAFSYLTRRNIVKGFSDGTGKPSQKLTRVEGLASVLRMKENYAPQVVWFTEYLPEIALFSDLDQSAWYAPYVEVGFLEGIITGVGNGTFQPGGFLTVEQALSMLRRTYDENGPVSFQTSDRLGNIPNQWFTDAVSSAIERNLIAPGEHLTLGTPITRGQFFQILYRLHTIKATNAIAFRDPLNPTSSFPNPNPNPNPNPISITPLPGPLPPPTTTFGPPPPIQHQYASMKEFAISIPSLNILDVTITHPSDPFSKEGILAPLKEGLGHLFAYPGNSGKAMIYGHSSGYPWDISEYTKVFRQINKLTAGENIYITYNGALTVYEVVQKQVIDAKDVTPFNDDGTTGLILYTCWPPDSIKQRYLVHAVPVETVALR